MRKEKKYCEEIKERMEMKENRLVVEIERNEGYMLKNLMKKKIKIIGIEKEENVERKEIEKGVKKLVDFLG